jgi:hypothetical protein
MLNLKHGGHAIPAGGPGAQDAAKKLGHELLKKDPQTTPFDYLLPQLKGEAAAHLPGDPAKVTADLKALGKALVDSAPATTPGGAAKVNSTIPAIYTYWGQFIDHDMTASADNDPSTSDITKAPLVPVAPDEVTQRLRNMRRPTFDLDSVYGNGPGLDPGEHKPDPGGADKGLYNGIRLRVGECAHGPGIPGVMIPPNEDVARDLPRIGPLLAQGAITEADIPDGIRGTVNQDQRAFIGDMRNDENLVVAQFHLAFLRFHNKVVDAIEKNPKDLGVPSGAKADKRYEAARRLVCHHYQWLVVNDYLKTVCMPDVVDDVVENGNRFYKPLQGGQLFAPLEYTVAAYRFGHSMVRGGYDHNRNFGQAVPPNSAVLPFASFDLLFLFTGNGHVINSEDITKSKLNPFLGQKTLPFNWIIEWDRFSRKDDPNEAHFARKIDTVLAPPIHNMVNEGTGPDIQDDANKPLRRLLRALATRNLLRGYLLSIPTGQAMADAMGIDKLSEDELRQGNPDAVNAALENGGFLQNTPAFYYILKEAEVRADGNSLGELGSRIVAETQIGLMRNDKNSFMQKGWDPSKGVKLSDGSQIKTIRDLLKFAGLPT